MEGLAKESVVAGRLCWRFCSFEESGILKVFTLLGDGTHAEIRFGESLTEEMVMSLLRISLERYVWGDSAINDTGLNVLTQRDSGEVLSWSYSEVMVEMHEAI